MDEEISNDGRKFGFLVEREKLRNNLDTARRMVEQASSLAYEMERLLVELEANRNDTRLLKVQLNRTAVELGLQPMPIKSKKPKKKRPA